MSQQFDEEQLLQLWTYALYAIVAAVVTVSVMQCKPRKKPDALPSTELPTKGLLNDDPDLKSDLLMANSDLKSDEPAAVAPSDQMGGGSSTMTAVGGAPIGSSTMPAVGDPVGGGGASTMTAIGNAPRGASTMTAVGAPMPGGGSSTMTAVGGAPVGSSTMTAVGDPVGGGGASTMTAIGNAPRGASTMTAVGAPMPGGGSSTITANNTNTITTITLKMAKSNNVVTAQQKLNEN
uniref:Uncharacterized protein n=1 Tax=Panagrolaimus davidi TaxID=227884 RepID=A0A914PEK6_9BILA